MQHRRQLGFAQLVVAPQQEHDGFAVNNVNQRLDHPRCRLAREGRQIFDGLLSRSRERFRSGVAREVRDRFNGRPCLLQIGCVTTIADGNVVFAGIGGHHEFVRDRPAHRPGIGLGNHVLQAAAVKDAAISVVVFLITLIETSIVEVE